MTARAWFITVEGLEGAGKTSCLARIDELLSQRGLDPVMTREPGGTALGETIRGLLLGPDHRNMTADTETLLVFAARAQHLAEVIRPALAAGRTVVCDRFTDASYAYQGGGRGLGETRVQVLEEWVQQGLEPDLTLYLDVPPQLGLDRAGQRSAPDRFEQEQLEFFERARQAYRRRAEAQSDRIVTIDATASQDEVQAAVLAAVERKISGCG